MVRLTTFLTAATLLAAPAALAEGMDFHHPGMAFLAGVSLTDAQKAQIHQIADQDRAQMHAAWGQMRAVHDQLRAALLSGASHAKLAALMQQEETLRDQEDAAMLAEAEQVRALLTPAQLAEAATNGAKLADLRAQEHALMHHTADND